MKTTTIDINGKPFSFEDEDDDLIYQNIKPITEEDGQLILETTKKLFDEIGLEFYLAYGTLLGAVRDKGIIPGDEDVDVMVKDETTLYNNLPTLYEKGLKVVRVVRSGMYSFRINERCYIDVYIIRPLRHSLWSIYCYAVNYHAQPKRFFDKIQEISFLGGVYKCPHDPEQLLTWLYGDWRTPTQSHYSHEDVTSYRLWMKVQVPVIVFIKRLLHRL